MKFARSIALLGLSLSSAFAFAPSPSSSSSLTLTRTGHFSASSLAAVSNEEEQREASNPLVAASTAMTTALLTSAAPALAAGPDWGLFEGRTGSLIHPVVMGGLFLYLCYTAFLGFQWRRQRTLGDEISALKATLPAAPVAAADEEVDPAAAAAYAAQIAPIQGEIDTLTQERKDLAAAKPRDQHFSQGALLAFLGTGIAIEGCLNTYGRAGKLFPGPHLFVGAGLVVLWGLVVATIPAMQKGNETARTVHIGANIATLAMFAWQIQSGIPILFKVIEKTSWP